MFVLELYSGIGGMHCAFERSSLKYKVVQAVDINDVATTTYKHNFPETPTFNRIIESLDEGSILRLGADTWSLSPPCQPFTRLGNRKCEEDSRSDSFLHVLDLIKSCRPKKLILENVKGFEYTEPWRQLIQTLDVCDYEYEQFLLSPLQFGVPNCRLRFYLVARLKSSNSVDGYNLFSKPHGPSTADSIHMITPLDAPKLPDCNCPACTNLVKHVTNPDENFTQYDPYCQPILNFLLSENKDSKKQFTFLTDDVLTRYFPVLDIVRGCDTKTRCFTKGYSKRFDGTGSVLQTKKLSLTREDIHSRFLLNRDNPTGLLSLARSLGLRFFHSSEVASLLCFPGSFGFPDNVTEKQRIRLLGNSLNVLVVAHLIYWAFSNVT
ncbi:unnamed protein product [Calicophoron daubneyi]|uniref:DNA methyltransferase 2 n=1 Tax=Calicophoron daubneyi TaxID=300641 RepID=A0AAV2TR27_CALDB